MQFTGGAYQVLDSQGAIAGYMACGIIGGDYYDWFASKNSNPLSTPLNLQSFSFGYSASDQTWISNLPAKPTAADWEAAFATFLDGEFGVTKWAKKNKYVASEQTW